MPESTWLLRVEAAGSPNSPLSLHQLVPDTGVSQMCEHVGQWLAFLLTDLPANENKGGRTQN